jgi:alkylation response protein AidB-like acyl-CoA dehydrogenase
LAFLQDARGHVAYEAALKYARASWFDQPIAKSQAVPSPGGYGYGYRNSAQYTYYAAAKRDRGERCDLEAGIAKLFASEMALKHTWSALQIHEVVSF